MAQQKLTQKMLLQLKTELELELDFGSRLECQPELQKIVDSEQPPVSEKYSTWRVLLELCFDVESHM